MAALVVLGAAVPSADDGGGPNVRPTTSAGRRSGPIQTARHAPTGSLRYQKHQAVTVGRLIAADPTPVNPDPQAPGMPVGSDQHESDPFLLLAQGKYYLYTSNIPGSPSMNVPVSSATTFGTWTSATDVLPVLPAWATPGFTWAPDVHQFGSTFVLYFTAIVRGSSPSMECIGDAVGTAPGGPFTPVDTPFICQVGLGGSIDPRVFTDSTGANWMVWKSDQNIGGATTPTTLWSQPLSVDGLGLTGAPAALMQPDEAWQGTIVEAPDMVEVDGTYWIFYSGNWFNQPAYAIGAARCAGPSGPCADSSPRPLLATNSQGPGPGEASIYQDPTGDVWMLYTPWHSMAPEPDVFPRPVYVTRLGFQTSGPYPAAWEPLPTLETLIAPRLLIFP